MRATLLKLIYIPWVLLLFIIAAILTLLELVFARKYRVGSQ
jgi:hypothetical protein